MRVIDGDRLDEGLKMHRQPTDQKHEADRQWAVGYNAGLDRALHSIYYAPTLTPPNEPLTQADLDSMDYDKVWIDYEDGTGEWALVCGGRIYSIDTLEGAGLDFNDYMRGERIENCGYIVYRRPPEEGETAC